MTDTTTPPAVDSQMAPAPVAQPADEPWWDGRSPVRTERWWTLSILVSLILLVILMLVWLTRDHRAVRGPDQLTTMGEVDTFLKEKATVRGGLESVAEIPTGVFVQTLQITSSSDVHITGYVWQRFEGDVTAELNADEPVLATTGEGKRISIQPGFVLPDQVDSSFKIEKRYVQYIPAGTADIPPTSSTPPTSTPPPTTIAPTTTVVGEPPLSGTIPPMSFRRTTRAESNGGATVIGWYFEAPVRERFDYGEYPFDHKTVKLRIWPADFLANVVLIPDFEGYPCRTQPGSICTGRKDIFGLDQSIVLGDFSHGDTYFDYFLADYYNSNFGLESFQQSRYPELQFNVLIRRNVRSALVSTLVPISVAAGLAFAVLLTITASRNRARRFGFSTTQVMATLAAVFFAVLIAHQQLRNQFKDIVYFDSFYFLIYLVILGVAINAVLVASPVMGRRTFFSFGDNLIPQLLYWPTLLLAADVLALTLLD